MISVNSQTTLADLQAWVESVRAWPAKPTSVQLKFLAASKTWQATICMVGGPVIGSGPDLAAAIQDMLAKVSR